MVPSFFQSDVPTPAFNNYGKLFFRSTTALHNQRFNPLPIPSQFCRNKAENVDKHFTLPNRTGNIGFHFYCPASYSSSYYGCFVRSCFPLLVGIRLVDFPRNFFRLLFEVTMNYELSSFVQLFLRTCNPSFHVLLLLNFWFVNSIPVDESTIIHFVTVA